MAKKIKAIGRVLAIDFETANRRRASACSVGLYLKEFGTDNVLFEKEILINPECDFEHFNMLIHGITPQMVQNEPNFEEVYKIISSLLTNDTVVVAHNAAFDLSVIRHSCDRYHLSYPSCNYVCTLLLSKAMIKDQASYSLDSLSDSLGFGEFDHHNALADAKTCALIFEHLMSLCGARSIYQLSNRTGVRFGYLYSDGYKPCSARKHFEYHTKVSTASCKTNLDTSVPVCIPSLPVSDDDENDPYLDETFEVDENHPFYQKTVCFTGALSGIPRSTAEKEVERHGGIPCNSITKKTNYLVFGYQDPKVLKGKEKSTKRIKAEKLAADGHDIQIITEDEFYKLLEE